jgi:hypothetical protein
VPNKYEVVSFIPVRTTCLISFFRQYKIYVRLIKDYWSLLTWYRNQAPLSHLYNENVFGNLCSVRSVVFTLTRWFMLGGYVVIYSQNTWLFCKYDRSIIQHWFWAVSHWWMHDLPLLVVIVPPAYVVCSILFPILTCTLTLTVPITCNAILVWNGDPRNRSDDIQKNFLRD